MRVFQCVLEAGEPPRFVPECTSAQLVLVFGSRALLAGEANLVAVRKAYPDALIAGCSTAGEIYGASVRDETLVITAIEFEHTSVRLASAKVRGARDSYVAGQSLVGSLSTKDLHHVLVFSDGLNVNGTELLRGLRSGLPAQVEITGGLSADGANFHKTLVCANGVAENKTIVAIGLYGQRIKIGYGSVGGWDAFGPERRITRSRDNVLFDLDGKPALELYKRYLGEHAAGLPATALLFPLSLRCESGGGVVRTILGVNEEEQSMTFAGDMPEGRHARLMKANFERLIDGAVEASEVAKQAMGKSSAELALLISCVGRKLVLKQRVDEEVEGVCDILGKQTALTGFYSYGEISPHVAGGNCELHNQTMTVTTFAEY